MTPDRVLVVDDEKNIRLTLAAALDGLGLEVETAADGQEALDRLEDGGVWLVLLDLKMPRLDGMAVLRRLRETRPEVRVVMITAHGDVGHAVEAMKLGAADFLPKPFAPAEVRSLVERLRDREALDPERADDYDSLAELARRAISARQVDDAREFVARAVALDDARPDGHTLLGVLHEIAGERFEAQERYRRALALDPEYASARANLAASVDPHRTTSFLLGEAKLDTSPPRAGRPGGQA